VKIAALAAAAALGVGVLVGRASVPAAPSPSPSPDVTERVTDAPSAAPAPLPSASAQLELPAPVSGASAASRGVPSAATTAAVPQGTLAQERELVEGARAALTRGRPVDALAATDRHAQQFPRGRLAEEREVLAITALASLGRIPEAEARRARFLRVYRTACSRRRRSRLATVVRHEALARAPIGLAPHRPPHEALHDRESVSGDRPWSRVLHAHEPPVVHLDRLELLLAPVRGVG